MLESSWIGAMQEEIHEFERLEVWELVPCPNKVLLIKLKWIFKVKTDEFSGVLKNKARLDNPWHVYKVNKALYGLKQAPRAWYDMLSSFLISQHFSKETPMVEKNKLDADLQGKQVDATHCRGMIGSLMYLTSSRPDLIHAICLCARYQAKPTEKHLHAVKRIFRYLKGTIHLGLWTEYQLADIFTKALPREIFNFLIKKLGMRSMSPKTLKSLAEEEDKTMNTPVQQTALENALVSPDNRVKIGKLPNQEFVEPPNDEEIASFIKELGYKGDIESITKTFKSTNLIGDVLQQNVDFVDLLWEDFMFQIDNKDTSVVRQENMPDPRFTKVIINYFISKDKSISIRNILFLHTVQDDSLLGTLKFVSKTEEHQVYGALIPAKMTNLKMHNSPAYETILAYATGPIPPKKARKFKKPASLSKKKTLVAVEESAKKHVKKPAARRHSAGVQIRDTPGVSVSKKKAPAKAKRSKGIVLLSEAALLEEAQMIKAIKRSKQETNIHQASGLGEGVGLELEVPDEPKGKLIDTKSDDDDDDQQDDEEYDRINEEMYSDDVELKYTELEGKGKDDEEMTDVGHVDAEHENINQEVAGDQVKDDAQETVTAAHATQNIKFHYQIISMMEIIVQHEDPSIQTSPLLTVPISIIPETSTAPATTIPPPIPPFIPIPQQSTPIPTPTTTETTTSTTTIPNSTTLSAIHQRVSDLEKEVTILKDINHDSAMALYHALMESIIEDEDAMDKCVADRLKKRKPDDADKDESPPAGPDQWLKRKKMSKETKPSKKAKSTGTSKGTTKSQPKSTSKSAQAEETVFKAADTQKPERPPTLDPKWNKGKTVVVGPTHTWLSNLAKVVKPSKTCDELMSTLIYFSAYAMNRLQISDLTQADLVGPVYKLLKGICRSYVELKYNMEECYKALND
ncbi:uncharacterized mitochondrial protein-like protein [Tanacetum coccineum]